MEHLLPKSVHRQLLLTSALMGMLNVVLDDKAPSGKQAALRVASLTARPCPENLLPAEKMFVALAQAARHTETAWQGEYWVSVLQPAVREYCDAEVLAVKGIPDLTGMGHRWAGIDAAIKGMWYVAGPRMGLEGDSARFEKDRWNREQQWMADTSLLMQMIDDWVDHDEDRGTRDLDVLLDASGIQKPVLKAILADLYRNYLHKAMDATRGGVAA